MSLLDPIEPFLNAENTEELLQLCVEAELSDSETSAYLKVLQAKWNSESREEGDDGGRAYDDWKESWPERD